MKSEGAYKEINTSLHSKYLQLSSSDIPLRCYWSVPSPKTTAASSWAELLSVCMILFLCLSVCRLYQLTGGPWRKAVHHFVHLLKLLGHGQNFCMQLLVLSILVIEHGLVLVPFLVRADTWVFSVGTKLHNTYFSDVNVMLLRVFSKSLATRTFVFKIE